MKLRYLTRKWEEEVPVPRTMYGPGGLREVYSPGYKLYTKHERSERVLQYLDENGVWVDVPEETEVM